MLKEGLEFWRKIFIISYILIFASLAGVLLLSFLNDPAFLKTTSYIILLLILTGILTAIYKLFKYRYNLSNMTSGELLTLSKILFFSLAPVLFALICFVSMSLLSQIVIGKNIQDDFLKEIIVPVVYVNNNWIIGLPMLLSQGVRIILFVTIVDLSSLISKSKLFNGFRVLSAIFFTIILYYVENSITLRINNLIIYLLGGPEKLFYSATSPQLMFLMITELIVLSIFVLVNVGFIKHFYRKCNIEEESYISKSP